MTLLKFRHAGQACITANRVYVQRGVYDKFAEMMTAKARGLRVGHGMEEGTTMGPLTVPQGIDKCAEQIEDAKQHGGRVLVGGSRVADARGYYFQPTVIVGATQEMKVASEETFAPLLALFPFDTEEEAVQAANDTSVCLPMSHVHERTHIHRNFTSLTTRVDGPGIVLFHEVHRQDVEAVREPGGGHDRHEHR